MRKSPPILVSVEALEGCRLRLVWADGPSVVVDLSRDVASHRGLAPLRDNKLFAQARMGEGGHNVEWPCGVDIGADSLWRDSLLAQGRADTVAFNDWRMGHGLSLAAAADALGLSRRMVAYYSAGDKPVPKTVLLACDGWVARCQRAA